MQYSRRALPAIRFTVITGFLAIVVACDTSTDVQEPPNDAGWVAERAARTQRQLDYLNDATVVRVKSDAPDRASWYSNRLGYEWFADYPLGVNGVPFLLLRTIVEVYPEIWKGNGSLGNLGMGPHPDDYDPATGKLLPAEQRHPLPYGLVAVKEDSSVPEDQRGNTFFSCATCHTARVYVDGRVRHFVGGPNSEIEAQGYAGLLLKTGMALMKPDTKDVDPAQLGKIMEFLKSKAESDPAWFYGGRSAAERETNALRAKTQAARLLASPETIANALIRPAKRTRFMYLDLANGFYSEKDGQKAPGLFGPRPGRMDAFGISTTLVALHGAGVANGTIAPKDSFLNRLPDDHLFFQGLSQHPREQRLMLAGKKILDTAGTWLPRDPGASDIKALWYSRDHALANWDANQGAEARVLASGVSSVGDPAKVDVRVHEAMNPFIDGLPPPAYPFEVDLKRAEAGKPLFEAKCASCHKPKNNSVYDVGTDMNRARQISATARLGLVELTREACERYVDQGGSDWCRPKRGSPALDDEAYFVSPREKPGYKADVLHGIWAQAPYLHNGSVPTLWHLMRPNERPAKFVRGNIKYDEIRVGFVWDKAPSPDEYGAGDSVHSSEHDVSLRGNSNAGHTFGSQWTDDEVRAVIEYLKTL